MPDTPFLKGKTMNLKDKLRRELAMRRRFRDSRTVSKMKNVSPSLAILATPLFVFQMAMLGLGVGLIITSLTTKYRDMAHLVTFAIQLWMYATPIVYPLSMVPEKWRSLYMLNPVVPVLEGFNHAFFSTGMPSFTEYGISIATTFILLFGGILVFNLVERNFVDTV